MTRIVILGGGFAGLFTAKSLRKKLGDTAEIEIISEKNYFVFQPLLPEVAGGAITAPHAVTSLRSLLPNVKTRQAKVYSVDFDTKTVTVFQGIQRRPTKVQYDHLVIALGQSSDLSRTPGLTDHALTMKSLNDASRLRAHVIERLEHADVTALPEVKREALTFCVVGGGFSGVETVGEIKELIDKSLRFYPNIAPEEVRVVLLEFASNILNELPARLQNYAMKNLERRGIEVLTDTGVAKATGTVLVTTNGDTIGTRTIVATIGNAPSKLVQDLDVKMQFGKIAVNRDMKVDGQSSVWSLGDCALIPLKDRPETARDYAPPTAQFAVREAVALADNIKRELSGIPTKAFYYTSKGSMASLGAGRGVAEVYGLKLTGFVAWLLWRTFYLSFLPGMATRSKVLLNWIMDFLTPRSTVHDKAREKGMCPVLHYQAGDRIFEAGNRADGFYTIIKGRVEVTFENETGLDCEPLTITEGGHFGERLILGEKLRTGTVRALEDTEVLLMDQDDFQKVASAFPAFQDYFRRYFKSTYEIDWRPEK